MVIYSSFNSVDYLLALIVNPRFKDVEKAIRTAITSLIIPQQTLSLLGDLCEIFVFLLQNKS